MLHILIAEDHALVRSGLRQLFATASDIRVVGEAVDGGQVLSSYRSLSFDVLLLDLNMPGLSGVELIARLKSEYPRIPILVLSMHNTVQVASKALKAGANGYLTKDSDPELLMMAVRKVAAGGNFMDPALAEKMLFDAPVASDGVLHDRLSERELQVFLQLVQGTSVNEVAERLNISNKTVSTHKARIMEKLMASSNADLVLYAVEHRLIANI